MGHPKNTNWGAQVSITFTSAKGIKISGAVNVNHRMSNFAMASGFGVSYYSNFMGTRVSGIEARVSGKLGFDDGTTSAYLGTNQWMGIGRMKEFNQRTGIFNFRVKDFSLAYENDGAPPFMLPLPKGRSLKLFADGGDSYRSAAAAIGYKSIFMRTNMFTGKRDGISEKNRFMEWKDLIRNTKKKIANKTLTQQDIEGIINVKMELMKSRSVDTAPVPTVEEVYKKGIRSLTSLKGPYGETYTNLLTLEEFPNKRYRFSTFTLGYGGIEAGVESEKVRHLFQNRFAHDVLGLQPQWEMLSNRVKPYFSVSPFKFQMDNRTFKFNYFGIDQNEVFTLW